MGSNQTMDKIIGNQRAVISRIFPYGIVNPHLIFGPSDNETRNLRLAYKAIKGKNLLLEMPVDQHAAKSKMVNRAFLPEEAYRAYFYDSDDFEKWEKTKYMTIRGPETAETIMRWTRIADAQLFLAGAGVSTIFDAITQGFDPFIFGKMKFSQIRERESFTMLFWRLLAREADECNTTLGEAAKTEAVKSIFVPAPALHPNRGAEEEKWTNNTVGVLIDLLNHSAYAVYKFPSMANRWYWSEKAYCHLAANVRLILKELGLEEEYHKYHALDAIVLIEKKSEIKKCLEMAEQIPDRTCYGTVRVVKMDQAGISQIKKILSAPTTNIYDAEKAMCAELFKDISLKRGGFTGRLIEAQTNDSCLFEDEVFLGLDFDLLKIKNFTRKIRNRDGSLPRIVIYPEQKELFSKLSFSGEKIIRSAEQLLVLPHR